ncbi:hypothetical protein ACEPPN_003861 [Leptodophora sp. 'Broadleaf-Isolate-01']
MQLPPYWLTSKAVDGFEDSESVAELDTLLQEYFDIYEEEEIARNGILYQAPVMRHVWESARSSQRHVSGVQLQYPVAV